MDDDIVGGGLGRLMSSVNSAKMENREDNGAGLVWEREGVLPPFFASVRSWYPSPPSHSSSSSSRDSRGGDFTKT